MDDYDEKFCDIYDLYVGVIYILYVYYFLV